VLNEYGIHTELRKLLSEKISGALGFEYKQRRGNDGAWVTTTGLAGNALLPFDPSVTTTGNVVLPDMYMDRNRTKLRANLDWDASEKLSLQAVVEHSQDDYQRAVPAIVPVQLVPVVAGARTITSDSLSLDTTYLLSDDWRFNGYWTHSYNRWNVNKVNIGDDTRNTTDTFGIAINGKATSRVTVGMDVLATRDVTKFNNVVATSAGGNIAGFGTVPGNYLPSINYTTEKLNLHAKYALDTKSDVQAVISWQHFKTDDWQWGYNGTPYLYSDNTTVSQPANQHLMFVATRYTHKF
jgi:hypothetical protein